MISDSKKINASVSFGRARSTRGDDYFVLRVEDKDSCCQFLELKLDNKQFADLMSSTYFNAIAEVSGLDKVGKVRELKSLKIPINSADQKGLDEAIRLWNSLSRDLGYDGWNIRPQQYRRGKINENNEYIIDAERWVEKDGNQKER